MLRTAFERLQDRCWRAAGGCASVLAVALVLSAARTASADVFRIIDSDREAAQVRADMILRAQREIALELFRAASDRMSLAYLALLRDAARRGVTVRVLIDASFNFVPKAVQAQLLQEGVQIREYHPLRLNRLGWVTRRLHDKLLLGDRREMLIGGRNVENPFFGVPPEVFVKKTYVDRDAYIRGAAVEGAYLYFHALWGSAEVRSTAVGPYDARSLNEPCDPRWDEQSYGRCAQTRQRALADIKRATVLLDRRRVELEGSPLIDLERLTDWSAGQSPIDDVRFYHDPVGRKGEADGTFDAFLELLENAEHSVLIESPYLILTKKSQAAVERALARGVRVRVLTNSLASTQNFYAHSAYERKKARLVQLGIEIWEYKGPAMLHAKSAVIDDRLAVVGSFNIDPRSEFLNTELAVVAGDQAVARQLRASMDAHLANARRIAADGLPVGEHRRFPGVSRGRIVKLRWYQLFTPLIEKQL